MESLFFDHKLYSTLDRLSNSRSTVTQLWNPTTLRNPEDGDDTFSEKSVRTRGTWYEVPEDIFNWYRRESIPEDGVLHKLYPSIERLSNSDSTVTQLW
jgi:hypothetical protein